jgi:hypothetical protein
MKLHAARDTITMKDTEEVIGVSFRTARGIARRAEAANFSQRSVRS